MNNPTDILKAINEQTKEKFDNFILMADGGEKTLITGEGSREDMAYLLYEAAKKAPQIRLAMIAALTMLGE
ncbi:hypothetical protein H5S09_04030 [Limosilactobacillus sp. STM2_1]|uniref:Uncharacterized protein n=1 Tax=Limosilactobacillus rudii TaxID=2759755 RepID=A0A7W3YNA9_9LACO|nr:hypothetical protein [Limosilactobacillus rudii]MBB1078931.1 hypothetical protein [Limosilactobacillus rudii]MBB1097112.1 hypothetical protein [Limosilactobacillus rudii]MCD7134106.1 hypothetical protein [Limosilactobacillus rudii]